MGWATEDATIVADAKVLVAQARQSLYKVRGAIQRIGHKEKREAMMVPIERAYAEMDEIDRHLNR
jgi:hypothetical protein